ncbi:MAG: ATP-binding protein, partial [Armatimonadetes bacterium]|nr:ATP-binding protein [Armatimonadota bacterium]
VWTWEEHLRASHLLGQEPTRELIFLVDELEAHLHPRWQRTLLRALLTAVAELSPELPVQLLVTTHSPLVMASAEPWFASEQDAWFDLDLTSAVGESPQVRLQQRPWVRQGDATSWLLSEAFDLKGAGAIEREQALEEAALALSDEQFGAEQARILHERLRSVLPDTDPFWMRWRYVGEKRGWLP